MCIVCLICCLLGVIYWLLCWCLFKTDKSIKISDVSKIKQNSYFESLWLQNRNLGDSSHRKGLLCVLQLSCYRLTDNSFFLRLTTDSAPVCMSVASIFECDVTRLQNHSVSETLFAKLSIPGRLKVWTILKWTEVWDQIQGWEKVFDKLDQIGIWIMCLQYTIDPYSKTVSKTWCGFMVMKIPCKNSCIIDNWLSWLSAVFYCQWSAVSGESFAAPSQTFLHDYWYSYGVSKSFDL